MLAQTQYNNITLATMPFSDHATLTYTVLGLFSLSALAFLLSQPTDFAKWVQKKKYQYEVTFALYMLTPTEKFIFSMWTSPVALRKSERRSY
jgi:hypothetical protein